MFGRDKNKQNRLFGGLKKICSVAEYIGKSDSVPQPICSHRSNICCPRDCVSRHNGGTAGALLKPLRDDSAFRALSSLSGLRGVPMVPPFCRETQSLGQQMLNAPFGINGLNWDLSMYFLYDVTNRYWFFAGIITKGITNMLRHPPGHRQFYLWQFYKCIPSERSTNINQLLLR